jgi:hypothetical protein
MAASFQSTFGCDEASFGERGNLVGEPSCDRECQSLRRLEALATARPESSSDVDSSFIVTSRCE